MNPVLQRLWQEEDGAVLTTEMVLVATITVIGTAAGLSEVREAVDQELGDLANAVGALNQSYNVPGLSSGNNSVAGSGYSDTEPDPVDTTTTTDSGDVSA